MVVPMDKYFGCLRPRKFSWKGEADLAAAWLQRASYCGKVD